MYWGGVSSVSYLEQFSVEDANAFSKEKITNQWQTIKQIPVSVQFPHSLAQISILLKQKLTSPKCKQVFSLFKLFSNFEMILEAHLWCFWFTDAKSFPEISINSIICFSFTLRWFDPFCESHLERAVLLESIINITNL